MSAGVVIPTAEISAPPTRRRFLAAVAAVGVIAAGAVTPVWLGWAPSVAVFSVPGLTLLWVLHPEDRNRSDDDQVPSNWVRSALLSVMLSTAIVILALVSLDVAGISIRRASVALSVAAIEAVLAGACWVRGEPARERDVRVSPRLATGAAVVVVGAATLVAAIVGVHDLAPAPPTTPYARISWAPGSAPTGVEPVSPGPAAATVSVQSVGPPATVQLQEYLDGDEMAPPVTVNLRPDIPVDVTLTGAYPALDTCLHRVQVILSAPTGGGDLSVTRYVRGTGTGSCRAGS
jgi:hypothetical protein